MMKPSPLTLSDYLGPYADHPDATAKIREDAVVLLERINAVIAIAMGEGVVFQDNPKTRCLISGSGNGGFRPRYCGVGAQHSQHKEGHAVDIQETAGGRRLARWCLQNLKLLERLNLYMENPQWTPTWVHLQDVAPPSGKRVFLPSNTAPLAPRLPEQELES